MATARPGWWYDDLPSVGIAFADPAEVAAYDDRQGRDDAEHDAVLDRLAIGSGSVLIDIGCGTGLLTVHAAVRGTEVHAVDVSEAMLRAVRTHAAQAKVPAPATHHAGFLGYAHVGKPADAVVSSFALHHLPDFWKQEAFVRIRAMLRPGGAFFLRDVAFSFDPAGMRDGVERWIGGGDRGRGRVVPRGVRNPRPRGVLELFLDSGRDGGAGGVCRRSGAHRRRGLRGLLCRNPEPSSATT